MFRRLAVFAGGAGRDQLETVCRDDDAPAEPIIDRVSVLVDSSLVRQIPGPGATVRFGMLETIREYARERLEECAEAETIQARHAAIFLALAEEAEPELTGPSQAAWLDRLETDHDNLRAALGWGLDHESETALRLAAAIWRFWYMHGHLREGRRVLSRALAASAPSCPARGAAVHAAGVLASILGDASDAAPLLVDAHTWYQARGDRRGMASVLNSQGDLAHALDDRMQAAQRFEAALNLFTALDDRRGRAVVLTNLGILAGLAGDLVRAGAMHHEARELYEQLGDQRGVAWAHTNLATVARIQGDVAQAAALLSQAREQYEAVGDKAGVAETVEGFANIAAARDRAELAARLFAAAATIREAIGEPLAGSERQQRDAEIDALRLHLGTEFAAAWCAGETMSADATRAASDELPIVVR